ncbi:restriction endonuclease subunit S [Lachnospiraceae bacterium 42-17]|jgi:type I restriction enzyme S subunit
MTYSIKLWSEILQIISGKNQKAVEDPNGSYPIYGSGGTMGFASDYLCEAGTTIIGRKGTINNPIFVTERFWNVDTAFGLVPGDMLHPKYLYYFCVMFNFKELDKSTTIPSLAKRDLLNIKMPVPPLPEQERIVANIEELFSELDKAVETLQTTKQQLAVYRQAVLKEALEGKYTENWRGKNPSASPQYDFETVKINHPVYKDTSGDENEMALNLPKSWLKVRFGDIFDVQVGATPSRRIPAYWSGDIHWVSSGEVRFNTIFQTGERITEEGLKHSSTNIQPIGTVMLAMIGEGKTRGQAAILAVPAAHNQNTAAILVPKTPCNSKYVYYFLQMNYENTRRVGSGNNQKALNKERVRALRIPFTSFAEQKEIVEEIESRLSVCDSIEQTVDTALQQADALRQSILKEAFERRL